MSSSKLGVTRGRVQQTFQLSHACLAHWATFLPAREVKFAHLVPWAHQPRFLGKHTYNSDAHAPNSAWNTSQCNICSSGFCNHGTCDVQVVEGGDDLLPMCTCDFGYSHASNCSTNVFGIVFGVFMSITVVLVVALALHFRRNSKYRAFQLQSEMTQKLLDEKSTELEEIQRVWRIPAEAVVLEKHLASGTFGEVWLGQYDGREVAIKQLRSKFQLDTDALESEIRFLRSLRHKHIVFFYGDLKYYFFWLMTVSRCRSFWCSTFLSRGVCLAWKSSQLFG